MSTLVRQLIAFDIIKQELEEVSLLNDELDKDSIEDAHLQLLKQCSVANQAIIDSTVGISEFDFAKIVSQVELEIAVSTKQLLTVHNKLLSWAISFFVAKEKANSITSIDFSEQAEVRLDLWQTKAAKAKNQIKTLANALGKREYVEFITQYRLTKTELMWPLGK
ncbi:MAG: DNA replication initiation complex subunit (GINS family) [Alphaproteobacteria bacterium]|jgi:DNA replication initiation complex subunit (GINS family)